MSGKAFIDANVFVYAHDETMPVKRAQARELIAGLMQVGSGAISTQVMQEFYVVSTRKRGVAPLAAKAVLKTFSAFEIVQVTPELAEQLKTLIQDDGQS